MYKYGSVSIFKESIPNWVWILLLLHVSSRFNKCLRNKFSLFWRKNCFSRRQTYRFLIYWLKNLCKKSYTQLMFRLITFNDLNVLSEILLTTSVDQLLNTRRNDCSSVDWKTKLFAKLKYLLSKRIIVLILWRLRFGNFTCGRL